ncbi:MAG: hypothetical protein P8Y82_04440, partial [Methyloceanibacter sp.]
MRVARHVLSRAAGVAAVAVLVLGIAHAETGPDDPAAEEETDFGARGSILEDGEPFPIEGLYSDKKDQAGEDTPPDMEQRAEPDTAPQPDARPVDTSAQFQAVYNVSLGRFNLGNFSI